jgi:hypothetical protein
MKRSLAVALVAAALTLPAAARADNPGWGIRAGLEAPLATHINDGGSFSIGDSFQPGLNILVQKGPSDLIAFGLEGQVNFVSTGDSTKYKRTGTSIGPEVMLNIPVVPLYLRVALPIRIEPSFPEFGLRVAAGFKINIPVVGIYVEGVADMPFVGNNTSGKTENAFSQQILSVGAGIEIRI